MELVCWPANREAISRPAISSSVVLRPPYTFWYLGAGTGGEAREGFGSGRPVAGHGQGSSRSSRGGVEVRRG